MIRCLSRPFLLVVAASLGVAAPDRSDPTAEIDGLYFLAAPPGSSRILRLRDRRFVIAVDHEFRIEGTAHWSRLASSARGELRLAYFDATRRRDRVLGRVSCALLDGEFWVGVMHADVEGDAEPKVWRGDFECTGLFAPAGIAAPPGRVEWRAGEGVWRFWPSESGEVVEQTGVSVESRDGARQRFAVNFQRAPLGDEFGFPWPRREFERRSDVLIAPWSVKLGVPGLHPLSSSAEQLAGVWRHGDEEVEMTPEIAPLAWSLLPPPADERPRKVGYEPDARGVSLWVLPFAGHPPMSHGDYPIHEYWFAISGDQLVRYRFGGGCNGLAPALGPDVFERPRD